MCLYMYCLHVTQFSNCVFVHAVYVCLYYVLYSLKNSVGGGCIHVYWRSVFVLALRLVWDVSTGMNNIHVHV